MYERSEVVEVPTIPSQESAEVVKCMLQERISERMFETKQPRAGKVSR